MAALGILAAPFAAVVLPFGLTLGAIAAGIALFGSGASAASIIHVAFHDGCYFVALADEELGSVIINDHNLRLSLESRSRSVIDVTPSFERPSTRRFGRASRAQLDEVAYRPTPLALPHAIAVQPVTPASSKHDLAPQPGGLLSAASDALSEAAASGANLTVDALGAAARFLKSRKGRFP